MDVAKQICGLMIYASKEFSITSIYFSAMLPKFGRRFDSMINYVNNKVFNLCLDNQKMEIMHYSNFEANHELNYEFFGKTKYIQVTSVSDN